MTAKAETAPSTPGALVRANPQPKAATVVPAQPPPKELPVGADLNPSKEWTTGDLLGASLEYASRSTPRSSIILESFPGSVPDDRIHHLGIFRLGTRWSAITVVVGFFLRQPGTSDPTSLLLLAFAAPSPSSPSAAVSVATTGCLP